jgi:hypothetical protein
MTTLASLWLPILVASVFVFIASSMIHMVLPWHKSDYPPMPSEDAVMGALRPFNIPPGDYFIPRPQGREGMKSADYQEKVQKGPVVVMTVMPNGMMAMGKTFVQWFVYLVIVSLFSAYVAGRALAPAAPFGQVLRFTGVAAFLSYSMALWPMSIWYRRSWSLTVKATVDGLVYALITGATFAWLWPG